jgi:hypothetical protein
LAAAARRFFESCGTGEFYAATQKTAGSGLDPKVAIRIAVSTS